MINIFDVQEIPEKGIAIVGTINSDVIDAQLHKIKVIKIINPSGKVITTDVIDVSIFTSFSNKKNAALLLSITLKGLIQVGSIVLLLH